MVGISFKGNLTYEFINNYAENIASVTYHDEDVMVLLTKGDMNAFISIDLSRHHEHPDVACGVLLEMSDTKSFPKSELTTWTAYTANVLEDALAACKTMVDEFFNQKTQENDNEEEKEI